jgi:ribonuclease HI
MVSTPTVLFIHQQITKVIVHLWAGSASLARPKQSIGGSGWCVILQYGKHERMFKGGTSQMSNRKRMVLSAVLVGLVRLKRSCDVIVHVGREFNETEKELRAMRRNPKSYQPDNPTLLDGLMKMIEYHKSITLQEPDDKYSKQANAIALQIAQYYSGDMYWCEWCGERPSVPNFPCRSCEQLGAK